MAEPLMALLRRIAVLRGYTSPDLILAAHDARQARRRPTLAWWKDKDDEDIGPGGIK